MGGIVGDDLFVVSGFTGGWSTVTDKVYGMNTKADIKQATWKEYDPVPVEGFSHAAFVVTPNRSIMFICGGYGTCIIVVRTRETINHPSYLMFVPSFFLFLRSGY
jgi:hypothetical protein